MKTNSNYPRLLLLVFFCFIFLQSIPAGDLMTKVMENDLEGVKELLDAGADINQRDERTGSTPLMMACSYRGYTEMVKLLLSYNPKVDIQEKVNGYTALIAAARVSKEVVELLIDKGADIHIKGFDGTDAFIASITGVLSESVTTEVASLLLSKGADINSVLTLEGARGMTSLMMAARNDHPELVKFLVENEADVNLKAKDGSTALSYANEEGYTEIVNYLKENGARE